MSDWRVGGCLALVFFLILFGTATLDPTYIDWLLENNKQDSIQHFVGWEFFRHESWHFPFGIIRNYGYPVATSVIYTDSIPILALFFKCFAAFLPKSFQYFGLWYAVCFILQGAFAWSISSLMTTHKTTKVCITLFFVLSPIMLNRVIEHQALVAHWVILAGFFLYFRPYDQHTDRWWLGLNAVTLLIHAYLAFMVLALWGAFLFKNVVMTKLISVQRWGTLVIGQGTILIGLAWLAGYFILPMTSIKDPFTYHSLSMNLLAPFIPTSGAMTLHGNWSSFIATFYPSYFGQGTEGFNYLGLGMLCLLVIAVGYLIMRWPHKKNRMLWLPLIIVCLLMTSFALSNDVYLGQHLLVSYSLPTYLLSLSKIFRASGRFFWPAYYLLMVMTFAVLSSRLKPRVVSSLLMVALSIQFIDLSGKLKAIHLQFTLPILVENTLHSLFEAAPEEHYQHLVFLPQVNHPTQQIKRFGDYLHYAASHNMTVNVGYFAREDRVARYQMNKQLENEAFQGIFSSNTIYIIVNRPIAALFKVRLGKNGRVAKQGSYLIFFPQETHALS